MFVDQPICYWDDNDSWALVKLIQLKPGYGLGFRQYNGILSLDISIGFSEGSSGGKIHLKLSSDI